MYNQPYFIPGNFSPMATPTMMRGAMGGAQLGARSAMGGAMNGAMMGARGASRGLGLFGRLGNSLAAVKGINWGGLITNASKTLNVVNQAIPLVRQVGPMMSNMRSMLRVASIFKDETDRKPTRQSSNTSYSTNLTNRNTSYNSTNNFSNNTNSQNRSTRTQDSYNEYDNSPTFFVEA